MGVAAILLVGVASAQQTGVLRGTVTDSDFDAPIPAARVTILETGQTVLTGESGSYSIPGVAAGTYTLVITKEGYTRVVRGNVVVTAGELKDVDAGMSGEFAEMEEFIVQDLVLGGATEVGLLNLRLESPALMDSIGSDLLSRAGAGDAASGLSLVAGATVQDGKFAVIRGLPDRFVVSKLNNVRLPSSDDDTRAVELDQFPSAVIESIQVSKTFTPDQQGDASGGAVNIVLKGVPDKNTVSFSSQVSYNTNTGGRSDFLTYRGGGVNFLGRTSERNFNVLELNEFDSAGTSLRDSPIDHKWSFSAGGKHVLDTGVKIGAFASVFYERSSEMDDNRVEDSLILLPNQTTMVPSTSGRVSELDRRTSLYDVDQGTVEVKWGTLLTTGLETDRNKLTIAYLYTRAAEDSATLAEDTRGKEYFYPGHDPYDNTTPGHLSEDGSDVTNDAPYTRLETLRYLERTTDSVQFSGWHRLPTGSFGREGKFLFLDPEVDWFMALSSASSYEPDKRLFGELFVPANPFVPDIFPARHLPYKPGSSFLFGNFQRIWRSILEDSTQYAINLKFPFEQWSGDKGYIKFGIFQDDVTRGFDQNSASNFGQPNAAFPPYPFNGGPAGDALWEEKFSDGFADWPDRTLITASGSDVDYRGELGVAAWYWMADVPVSRWLKFVGGVRYESTDLSITNFPTRGAEIINPSNGERIRVFNTDGTRIIDPVTGLPIGDARFSQADILPAIAVEIRPIESVTLRGAYSRTIARQTFKELSVVQQQEYLGGDVFIGNPALRTPRLQNYDLRIDYVPYQGGVLSVSWFHKDIDDPIEVVQRSSPQAGFVFQTPENFPSGKLSGVEFELRQEMGRFTERLQGLSIGANATFIKSSVQLPASQIPLRDPSPTRDMTNAPRHLYNIFLTYDLDATGTQFGLFYTVRGDALLAGALGSPTSNSAILPSIYQTEYGTLNFSVAQNIGKHFKLRFQAKNLTDPAIETVYRSSLLSGDVVRTSSTNGIDLSISFSASFDF